MYSGDCRPLFAVGSVMGGDARSHALQRARDDSCASLEEGLRDEKYSPFPSEEKIFQLIDERFGKEVSDETETEVGGKHDGPCAQLFKGRVAGARYLCWYSKNCKGMSAAA